MFSQARLLALQQKWFKPNMPTNDVIWNTNCDILEQYYEENGTCNCPYTSVCIFPDGQEVKIGQWLTDQRKKKKGSKGGLSIARRDRLQVLVDQGKLIWDPKQADAMNWDVMYNALVEYGRVYGTCNVPRGYEEEFSNGVRLYLGKWVVNQRGRKHMMMEDHKRKLQALVDQGLFSWTTVRKLLYLRSSVI